MKDQHQAENRRDIPKPQVDIVCPPYEVVTCNCIVRNSTGDVVLRQPGDQVQSAGWWLFLMMMMMMKMVMRIT